MIGNALAGPSWRAANAPLVTASAAAAPCGQPRRRWASSDATSASTPPRKKIVFSGIQPTGIPHLGNYLGALSQWQAMQRTYPSSDELIFSIVGLHAITMPQDAKRLRQERSDMMAALLAIGLDPQRCTIFHQEQVPEHAELAWILNCLTPVGKLRRMTTWKSKLATAAGASGASADGVDDSHLLLGLFAYPVLQAADILLYRSTHVPVGEDQEQHLELTRDISDLFNRQFKTRLFARPQHMITPTKRILSLRDPTSKMSKSAPDAASRIVLTDSASCIAAKFKRAVTDERRELSYDPVERPGVSNLLLILSALRSAREGNEVSPERVAEELNGTGSGGRALKEAVTQETIDALGPIQKDLVRYKEDRGYLEEVERMGRDKARGKAGETMREVRRLLGFERG